MNGYAGDDSPGCYLHPKEFFVGVCPSCLKERLIVLALKQSNHTSSKSSTSSTPKHFSQTKQPSNFPKIFAFTSILNRLDFPHWRSDHYSHHTHDVFSSPEDDSFISIKFENNGNASWEKNTVSKVSLDNCSSLSWNNKSVIEHPKQRSSLRWRKRIGHLFQLIRLKRSNSGHVSNKLEGGVKVRKSWIKSLTKRRGKKVKLET